MKPRKLDKGLVVNLHGGIGCPGPTPVVGEASSSRDGLGVGIWAVSAKVGRTAAIRHGGVIV